MAEINRSSTGSSTSSIPIPGANEKLYGPGYFNIIARNTRPEWVKNYESRVKKFGKERANMQSPGTVENYKMYKISRAVAKSRKSRKGRRSAARKSRKVSRK
jgi:hypothetical protein